MIASIKLKGRYSIGVNDAGNLNINGTKLNVKDIPFIRYDFGEYVDSDADLIRDNMSKFPYSTQLLQISVDSYDAEEHEALSELSEKIAVIAYVNITDEEVDKGCLNDDKVDKIEYITDNMNVDYVALVDKTTKLNFVSADMIIEDLADTLGMDNEKFSVCNSPLSCNGYACLTAVKARELMSLYTNRDDLPLPTAKHEKSCCGCIQFIEVTENVKQPDNVKKNTSAKKSNTEKKTVKRSGISFGAFRF